MAITSAEFLKQYEAIKKRITEARQQAEASGLLTVKPGETTQAISDKSTLTTTQAAKTQVGDVVPAGEGFGPITNIATGQPYYPPTARGLTPTVGGVPLQPVGEQKLTLASFGAGTPTQPATQPTPTGGLQTLPFPTTQAQMLEYRDKGYYFDGKQWLTQKPTVAGAVEGIKEQITPTPDLEIDTFEYQGGIYRTNPDGSATLLRGREGLPKTLPSPQPVETSSFIPKDIAPEDPRIKAYQAIIDEFKATPSSQTQFEELAKQYNLPEVSTKITDIMTKAMNVEAQLEGLPADVQRRVQDFLITSKQAERLTAAEAKPLTALFNSLSRALGVSQTERELRLQEIQTIMGFAEKDTQRKIKALEMGFKMAELEVGLPTEKLEEEKLRAQIEALRAPTLKAADISTFTDEQGNVTAVNKATGETIWTAKIGRPGVTTPNISVTPIADPITGTARYTQIIDRDTGEVKYIDNATGEEVRPEEVQIKEGADPFDVFWDEMMQEMFPEGITF